MKMPARVAGMFQAWLRAALMDRPTKEQADASYLPSNTQYIRSIIPTENGFMFIDRDNNETTVDFPSLPEMPDIDPPEVATTEADGLMSASDKTKLDRLAPIAEATGDKLGGVIIGKNININGGKISVDDAGAERAGIMRLYNNIDEGKTDGAVTQAAIKAALAALEKSIASLAQQIKEVEGKITVLYRFKGTVPTYADLPKAFLAVGDAYNIEQDDEEHNIHSGDNVAWTGSSWDVLSGFVDLSNLLPKTGGTINGDLIVTGEIRGQIANEEG